MNDRSAPLSEVANQAEVARSTLHRYFPERADLIEAVSAFAQEQIEEICDRARIHEGPIPEALIRLALEYFERWDAVMWNYAETWGKSDEPAEADEIDLEVHELIIQGQAEGSIDSTIPAEWFQNAMYAVVYTSWEYERSGRPHAEAAMMVMVTLRKILAPPVILPPATTASD